MIIIAMNKRSQCIDFHRLRLSESFIFFQSNDLSLVQWKSTHCICSLLFFSFSFQFMAFEFISQHAQHPLDGLSYIYIFDKLRFIIKVRINRTILVGSNIIELDLDQIFKFQISKPIQGLCKHLSNFLGTVKVNFFIRRYLVL